MDTRPSTPPLVLRPVQPGDVAALAELRVRAMQASLEAVGRFDPDRARRRFLDHFDPQVTREILWDGTRVGVVVVTAHAEGFHIDHLYIEPAYQSRGIGAAVLRTVCEQADRARTAVRLGALKASRANAFYQRHGFVLVGTSAWDNDYRRAPE